MDLYIIKRSLCHFFSATFFVFIVPAYAMFNKEANLADAIQCYVINSCLFNNKELLEASPYKNKKKSLKRIKELCSQGVSLEGLDERNTTAFHSLSENMPCNDQFLQNYPVELINVLITHTQFDSPLPPEHKEKLRSTIIGALWAFKQLGLTQETIKCNILSQLPYDYLTACKGLCKMLAQRGDIPRAYLRELTRYRVESMHKLFWVFNKPQYINIPATPVLSFISRLMFCYRSREISIAEMNKNNMIQRMLSGDKLRADQVEFERVFPRIEHLPEDNLARGIYYNCLEMLKK